MHGVDTGLDLSYSVVQHVYFEPVTREYHIPGMRLSAHRGGGGGGGGGGGRLPTF